MTKSASSAASLLQLSVVAAYPAWITAASAQPDITVRPALPECCEPIAIPEVLDHCEDTRPAPLYEPDVNGCGPESEPTLTEGITFVARFGRADFVPACDDHDRCYGTCNADKEDCDDDFQRMMEMECIEAWAGDPLLRRNPLLLVQCITIAAAFHEAVDRRGAQPFRGGQIEACWCCDRCAELGGDAGAMDAGPQDAGSDAGVGDAGRPDAGEGESTGTAVLSFAIAPESMTVNRVGQQELVADADGIMDGVFDVVIRGPVDKLFLLPGICGSDTFGVNSTGQWDTTMEQLPMGSGIGLAFLSTRNTWILGVEENGAFINNTQTHEIAIVDSAVRELKLYAQNRGVYFTPEDSDFGPACFQLWAVTSDFSVSKSEVLTYSAR